MNAKSVKKLNMFRAVQAVCENNKTIVSTNVAFATANTALSNKIAAIISAAKAQGKVITGITTDKNVDKDDLVQAAADIAGLVSGYASGVKNFTLKEAVDFSHSYIEKLKGDLLVTKSQDIYDSASDNLSVLGDTGITVDMLVAYKAKIEKYSKSLPGPRIATSEKSAHTDDIEELVKEANAILNDQMDKYIVNFQEKNPEFVALYNNARKVIDVSTSAPKVVVPAKEPLA